MNKIIAIVMSALAIITCEAKGVVKMENAEDLAVNLIAKYEGFSATPYTCAGGVRTIGYGCTDKVIVAKGRITEAEAKRVLRERVKKELVYVRSKVDNRKLTAKQEAALVSWVYNLGRGNFEKSTMLKRIKDGSTNAVVTAEMVRWNRCGGKVLNGLTKRRAEEKTYFMA